MADEVLLPKNTGISAEPWLPAEDLEPADPGDIVGLRVRGMTRGEREGLEDVLERLRQESYRALLAGECDACMIGGESALGLQAMLRGVVPYRTPDREQLLDRMYKLSRGFGFPQQRRESPCSPTCEFQTPQVVSALTKWRKAVEELDSDPDAELAAQVRASAAEMDPADPKRAHLLRAHGLTSREKRALRKAKADLLGMGLAASQVNDTEFFYIAIGLCPKLEAILEGKEILTADRIPRDKFEWAEKIREISESPNFADDFAAWKAARPDAPAWTMPSGSYWPDSA